MATTYKYNFNWGYDNPGYVKFNVSKEIVAPKDIINVSGVLRWEDEATKVIEVVLVYKTEIMSRAEITKTIPKATEGAFSLDVVVPQNTSTSDRISSYSLAVNASVGKIGGMNVTIATEERPQIILCDYRLAPQIYEMDFERAALSGSAYAFANDGQYLMCKSLRIGKAAQAVVGDFTIARLVCVGTDGSSRTANLTQAQLTAALTVKGYSETKPDIFAGFTSALGVSYTVTLTLGDAVDQVAFADAVMRSFARLHLSGTSTGGVAVGKFSAATEGHPLFEVAEDHESIFYGGIRGVTNYESGEVATGGTWVDGKPIYRYVWRGLVTFPGPYAVNLPFTPEEIVSMRGMALLSIGARPIPTAHTNTGYVIMVYMDRDVKSRLNISSGTAITEAATVTLALEYTRA